ESRRDSLVAGFELGCERQQRLHDGAPRDVGELGERCLIRAHSRPATTSRSLPPVGAGEDGAMNRAVPGVLTKTLLRVPLFEDLDEAEVQAVAESMHEANVPAGSVVTAEGGPGDGFFLIDRGEAKVTVGGQRRGRR